MKLVNPLYIGLFLLFILLVSIFGLNSAKTDLAQSEESYKETLKIANELKGLKKAYANKTVLKQSLQKILAQHPLKNSKIKTKFKNQSVVIQSESMDKKELNFLMSKILNNTYNITNLKIKKLSESNASLDMEIKW